MRQTWWRLVGASGAMLLVTGAHAQWEPSRMQMCEAELVNLTGEPRKRALGDCLRRRLEGEKIVERDCKRQVREVVVELNGVSRNDLHRQCTSRALQVSYTELPRRPPQAAKPEGGSVLVATDGTDTPIPAGSITSASAKASPAPEAPSQ